MDSRSLGEEQGEEDTFWFHINSPKKVQCQCKKGLHSWLLMPMSEIVVLLVLWSKNSQ